MQKNLTFGQALEAVKQGRLISREGWNGKEMFVFERPVQYLDPLFILEKVSTLPEAYKETLKKYVFEKDVQDAQITFSAYLCMKAADNSIVNGWLASQTDMLANDWCILPTISESERFEEFKKRIIENFDKVDLQFEASFCQKRLGNIDDNYWRWCYEFLQGLINKDSQQ